MNSFSMPDPRAFPLYDRAQPNAFIDTALEALATEQSVVQQRLDESLVAQMAQALREKNTAPIADALARAPNLEVLRHLTRRLAEAHVAAGRALGDADLPATVFAIPLIIIAGSSNPTQIPGAVPDVNELIAAMKGNGALRNNQTFALSNSLMSAATLALDQLPASLNWWSAAPGVPIAVPPGRMNVPGGQETAFLRFMVGSALAGPGVNLLTGRDTGKWGIPFTQALSKQLTAPNLTILAIPRPPMSPLAAMLVGQGAQREAAMLLFIGNAVKKFRERVGDPKAVISAHRTAEGGEVRLSLSNPFDEKGAEGFRAVLLPNERAQDVAMAMQELLQECKVEDITTLSEIFPDQEPATGMTLFFKPETIADAPRLTVH